MTVRMSTGLREDLLQYLKDTTFDGAVLHLFAGSQPTAADNTESSSTLLAIITVDGEAFNPGSQTNALDFGDISSDAPNKTSTLAKPVGTEWSGTALANGPIQWGRLYANARTTGDDAGAVRLDGTASTVSTSDFVVTSATAVLGVPVVVTRMNLKFISN